MAQTFAEGPVSDLIVILQEIDERRGRQMGTRFAAQFAVRKGRRFPLVGKTFGQAATEQFRRLGGVIDVVTVGFAGGENMKYVMNIIVPLGRSCLLYTSRWV